MKKAGAPQNVFVALSKDLHINAVHVNVAQEYIMITEDKTYRCLTEWQRNVQRRDSWIAPVSLLASLALTFVTATFRDAFGVPKETWQAVFLIGVAGSAIWALRSLFILIRSSGSSRSVEDLIDQLKKGAVIQRSEVDTLQSEINTKLPL
jgi:hypothetical protein